MNRDKSKELIPQKTKTLGSYKVRCVVFFFDLHSIMAGNCTWGVVCNKGVAVLTPITISGW